MSFCESCGGELKAGAKFCTQCGAPAAPVSHTEPAPQPEPVSQPVEGGTYQPPVQPIEGGTYQPPVQPIEGSTYQPPVQPVGSTYQPPVQPAGGTYQPPVQPVEGGTYQPPVQPVGGTYQPPVQPAGGTYQPPVQPAGGIYQPPKQQVGGPAMQTALKEKKPVNKKLLLFGGIGLFVIILAVVLIVVLGGGGGKGADSDPYIGVWHATETVMWGEEFPVEEVFGGDFSIELLSGGKCVMIMSDDKMNGQWEKAGKGVSLTVDGYDISCEIDGDTMFIEDYVGTGISITLLRGEASAGKGGKQREDGLKIPDADGEGQISAQEIWNGSWYGYFWVLEAYNEWEGYEDIFFDAYMVLDVDEEGYGTMAIFMKDDEYQTIDAYIYADEYHFEVTEGTFWDMALDPGEWWLGISPVDEGNLVVLSDIYIDPELSDGSGFEYMCCFRPFGELWTQEEREGDTLPPGYYDYLEALGEGITDPNAWGGDSSDSDAGEYLGENDLWGASYYGDGVGDRDVLVEAWNWAKELPSADKPTYEEICEKIGSKGEFNAPSEDWLEDVLYVKWETADGAGRMTMTFQMGEDGVFRYRSGGISGSLM